ncbi:Hypothetical protein R9X50_00200600 [Acrodontium crateriforme]|uniref:UDP-N-acetylglucosamine--dolichyl-phosphate N-acetylglucosaminephosphotransferase n=1 Tax=Acrodontium crateriforme TaxID=150365 RepID=A0AAQ3R367_9PEZI|nr:Hypothetical protein R9X50_00200600 [Acrodontium crateriforme]
MRSARKSLSIRSRKQVEHLLLKEATWANNLRVLITALDNELTDTAMHDLSTTETYSLSILSVACLAILINAWKSDGEPLFASLAISGIAFAFSYALVRWTADVFVKRGYKGRDLSKKNPVELPEAMGLVCALVYLLAVINFLPFAFKRDIVEFTSGAGNKDRVLEAQHIETGRFLHRFPLEKLASYGFAYGTLASVIILGILDDSFDMRWRHKFFIPAFAALPMLGLYFVDFGVTHVVVPLPLRPYLGELVDLGALYYLYMAAISIFCPNSINILAGINGIEVGQSLVIAFLIVANDVLYILPTAHQPHPAADSHLFSIYLLLPFIGVSLALFKHNWYPAKVFVGDTYCYFAGMVFAVVGILGHFSKTLLLLFIPQIFNFQFKDLNNGTPLDAWLAYSDTLFADRFSSLAGGKDCINPDIIELLTWNDFTESHYLRDLPSQYDENAKDFVELGDMGHYIWGQDHAAWRIIARYYLTMWKTGSPPAITTDQVVFWYHIHPKDAVCSGGSSTGIRNYLFPEDAVLAWALVKSPATISISVGSNNYQNFQGDCSGSVMGKASSPPNLPTTGVKPEVAIMRDNKLVRWAQGSKTISTNFAWQNFNPVVDLCGVWS